MRTPLLVAVPAFILGSLVTVTLTTTARAQVAPRQTAGALPTTHWHYRVVGSEAELNRYGTMGWEYCGQSSAASATPTGTSAFTVYTMRRLDNPFAAPGPNGE